MSNIDRMFTSAEHEARLSKSSFRVGAVVSDKRYILGRGRNSGKSHTSIFKSRYANEHTLMHAEIDALIRTPNAYKMDIFVCRIKKDGSRALARPCPLCLYALREKGVNRVFYTISNREYGVLKP